VTETLPPEPVPGVVIATARGKLVGLALGLGLLGFASAFVLWDSGSHADADLIMPFRLAKDSLFTWFVTGMCAFGGILSCIGLLARALFPRRLVLGEHVLQVLGPKGTVETQVPYENIATIVCEPQPHDIGGPQIGLDLVRPDAPGTYSRVYRLAARTDPETRDIYLPESLELGAAEIVRLVTERRVKKHAANGD
jgi:hypothetical protein